MMFYSFQKVKKLFSWQIHVSISHRDNNPHTQSQAQHLTSNTASLGGRLHHLHDLHLQTFFCYFSSVYRHREKLQSLSTILKEHCRWSLTVGQTDDPGPEQHLQTPKTCHVQESGCVQPHTVQWKQPAGRRTPKPISKSYLNSNLT